MRALLPASFAVSEAEAAGPEPFEWKTPDLTFSFDFSGDRLRQKALLPAGYTKPSAGPAIS